MSKAIVGASLLTLSLSARLTANEVAVSSEEDIGCPTPGVEAPDYSAQYYRIAQKRNVAQHAIDEFISAYIADSTHSCSSASPTDSADLAYVAMGNTFMYIAECGSSSQYPGWDDNSYYGYHPHCKYRIIVSLPDGQVLFDSIKGNGYGSGPCTAGAGNSVSGFVNGTIDPNQNVRVAVISAQENECGNQWETSFDPSVGIYQHDVAQRLGQRFHNAGTAQLFTAAYFPLK